MEAVGDPVSTIDAGALERVLFALDPDPPAGVLHKADRYALQVTVTASDPAEALLSILHRWAEAIRQVGLPVWDVVRAEVRSPEELERDLETDAHDSSCTPAAYPRPTPGAPRTFPASVFAGMSPHARPAGASCAS